MISKPLLFERFAGRDEELRFLADLRARSGREHTGSFVSVVGDAGVGKTRFINEFRRTIARERGLFVHVRCDDVAGPFDPILQVLARVGESRALAGQPAIAQAHDALTSATAFAGLSSDEQKYRRITAVVAALDTAARRLGHLTLAIDDAHWSDLSTLDALRVLCERTRQTPLLAIVAHRPDVEGDPPRALALAALSRMASARIVLGPLDARDLGALLSESLPDVAPAGVRRIVSLAEGLPFIAEELARNVIEARGRDDVPDSLRAAVLSRFERLTPGAQKLVSCATAVGRTFTLDDVAPFAASLADVLSALRAARDLQLIVETECGGDIAFRFRHALTREVLYRAMLGSERRLLHRSIAERLEALGDPARLVEIAYHAVESGDEARARDAGEGAGDYAMSVSAYADAAEGYERALRATPEPPSAIARLAKKAAKAMQAAGRISDAVELLAHAIATVDRPGNEREVTELRVEAARLCLVSTTDLEHAAALLAAIPREDPKLEPPLRFEVEYLTSLMHNSVGDLQGALDAIDRAQAIFPDAPGRRIASLHLGRGNALRRLGKLDEAERWYLAARALAESDGHAESASVAELGLGLLAEYRDDSRLALSCYERAEAQFERLGLVTRMWEARANIAQAALTGGDVARGRAIVEAAELAGAFELQRWILPRVLVARMTGAGLGDLLAIAERLGSLTASSKLALAAHLPWTMPDPSDARRLFDRLAEALPDSAFTFSIGAASAVFASDAAFARIVALLDAAAPHSDIGSELYLAFRARREHRPLAAREHALAAVTREERRGKVLELAQALTLAGDTARAVAVLQRAGALAELERLHAVPSGSGTTRSGSALSQREEQIGRLAATGLSSREIAERLSINVRTVESHVARVYEKLGIRSRAELVRALESV